MTYSVFVRGLALALPLACCGFSLQAQSAPAPSAPASTDQAAQENAVQLPEFDVTAAKANPYLAEQATSVSRVGGDIIDAPFTVNVVSSTLLNNLGANAGYDVDRYFAGLSAGRGAGVEGIMDRQDFRGFESFARTIDDFSSFEYPSGNGFQGNFDPEFVERQELVMGPDTILSPTGTPGGSVNVITKSPAFTESTDLSAEFGNYNADKYSLDTTGPAGPHLAYRVILDDQDTPTYIPGSAFQHNGAVMLTYDFQNQGALKFKWFYEDWGQRGEAANANDWGEEIYTPDTVNATLAETPEPGYGYRSWNGSSTWSRRNDRINIGELEYTMPIFDVVSMRLAAQYMEDHWLQDTAYPSVSPSVTYNQSTGYATAINLPASFNIQSMPVVGQYGDSVWRGVQLENDYAANFHPGGVSIEPVMGWAYEQGRYLYDYSAQDNNPADLPNVDLLANNGAQLVGAAQHPPLSDYTHSPSNNPQFGVQKQVYALTKVGLYGDRVFLTGGVSRIYEDTFSYKTTAYVADPPNLEEFVGPYSETVLDSQKDTFLGGAVLKPTENTSIYYTFSTNAAITSYNNAPVWQSGKQHEFGFKAGFFNQRLQLSGDHFQITQSNLVTPNPIFNVDTSAPPNLLVNATSKGYELNLVGGITPDLSVIGSITAMKFRDAFGRRVRNVPDHLANLLLSYQFEGALKGANVFAGVVHSGDVAGETVTGSTSLGVPEQPSFYVAGWTVLNVGTAYSWSRYRINLNLDNALDRKFFWDPASRLSVPVYDGLIARVIFTLHI